MSTTANMQLVKPVVGVTTGPAWATLLNAIFDLIDTHDHSSGKGVRISQTGINLTGDLELNANRLTEAHSVVLENLAALLTAASNNGSVYAYNGELYFRDHAGNNVKITAAGALNAAASGGFGGDYGAVGIDAIAQYTDLTKLYELFSDSGVYGHLKIASLIMQGSLKLAAANVVAVSGTTTIADDAKLILLVDTSAARTINLPAASAARRVVKIKDKTGSASTNNISVVPAGADTIEGLAATKLLQTNWGSWELVSDGTSAWYLL